MENLKAKVKKRLNWKDKDANIHDIMENADDYDSGDEETKAQVEKEYDEAEKRGYLKPGSLLARLIEHGNKSVEEDLRKMNEEYEAEQAKKATEAQKTAAQGGKA